MDAVTVSLLNVRLQALCEEMGLVLQRAAFSPNIRERLDFSCALFCARGRMLAQAAHIPVHIGSMGYAMRDIVSGIAWEPGLQVVLNDPFRGGTHLPDVTVIAPVFLQAELAGFVVNRAHHADIGADAPGSMPLSRYIEEEGRLIPPSIIVRDGVVQHGVLRQVSGGGLASQADFLAQIAANRAAARQLEMLISSMGREAYDQQSDALQRWGEVLARDLVRSIPDGDYSFTDYLDDDGFSADPVAISLRMRVIGDACELDFSGSADAVAGNLNCPLSVTAAAALYVFRCLMPAGAPVCDGLFAPVTLRVREGSLLAARYPSAVAAGNVETSSRVTDVVLGALAQALPGRLPAASQGTMNNLAMGSRDGAGSWSHYETTGGGHGASASGPGLSARQSHMTNTRNTPVEVLETLYPIRVRRLGVAWGSGGAGRFAGGDGIVRELEFLAPAQLSLLTERRVFAPWGIDGGSAGQCGSNQLNGQLLPGKCQITVKAGDVLIMQTPGGGGWGMPDPKE